MCSESGIATGHAGSWEPGAYKPSETFGGAGDELRPLPNGGEQKWFGIGIVSIDLNERAAQVDP